MKLTPERKVRIDAKSYEELLSHWRFAPVGDPWFEGETGEYWSQRMSLLRAAPDGSSKHVNASKRIGWDAP